MRIAIASGKGGTGKTTVAVNLALVASKEGRSVQLLDCDVEEPNSHLFLHPELETSRRVFLPVPTVDKSLCTACGECGKICAYSAIVVVKDKVLTFPELCHGCGGCKRVCPEEAIRETGREMGVVECGRADGIAFAHGKLRVSEVMPVPLIRAVKGSADDVDLHLFDAPPGTSCPVIETIRGSSYVLLVTEPTPFGLWDLGLALDMAKKLGVPHGIVVNRHMDGNESARRLASERGVEILAEIPDDRRVAEAYSRGEAAVDAVPGTRDVFTRLLQRLLELGRAGEQTEKGAAKP